VLKEEWPRNTSKSRTVVSSPIIGPVYRAFSRQVFGNDDEEDKKEQLQQGIYVTPGSVLDIVENR
jgi:hypothetical protein